MWEMCWKGVKDVKMQGEEGKEIIREETGTYLKVEGGQRESYSDKIFSYQEIPGFLSMEIRRINDRMEYIYDISGKISLEEYLAGGDFGIRDIVNIFDQIFDMAELLEEYLLDSRGIAVKSDVLFVDRVSGSVSGIYRDGEEQGIVPRIGRILEEIMEKMDQDDRELVFFIYGMYKLTKDSDCMRDTLRDYLRGYSGQPENKTVGQEQEYRIQEERGGAEKQAEGKLRGVKINGTVKKPEPARLVAAVIAVFCVIVIGFLWQRGMFRKPLSGETDWVKFVGACAFAGVAAGYGIWKTSPRKEVPFKVRYYDEEREQKGVCLIPQSGSSAPVPIPQFPFCLDKIQILQEAGDVMVLDEESSQGTYHNEKRLVPWQKTTVRDGDILRFSGKSYVVEITDFHI